MIVITTLNVVCTSAAEMLSAEKIKREPVDDDAALQLGE